MYDASEKLKNSISQSSREFHPRLVCGNEVIEWGFTEIKLTQKANPDDSKLTTGGTVSAQLDVKMWKPEGITIHNKEWEWQLGILLEDGTIGYVPMGIFTANKPQESYTGEITFTAYDKFVSKMDLPYFTKMSSYPAPATSIIEEICSMSGVAWEKPTGNALSMFNIKIPKRTAASEDGGTTTTNPFDGYTYREAIGYIAQMLSCFATINRSGKLSFGNGSNYHLMLKPDGAAYPAYDFEVPTNRSYSDIVYAMEDFVVQKIECTVESETLTSGEGTLGISISSPVMTQELLDKAFSYIKGFAYLPSTVSFLGNPCVELGDIGRVYKPDGSYIDVPVMGITQTFNGGLTTAIGSYGETEQSSTNTKGPTATALDRVYSQLAIFGEIVANKVSVNYLEANYASIRDLDAVNANIETLSSKAITTDNLSAKVAEIDNLTADSAIIQNVYAQVAQMGYLTAEMADIKYATIDKLNAIDGRIINLESREITADYLEANFANINFSNVEKETVGTLLANVGLITDATIVNGHVTGYLDSVSVNANTIKAGTLSVDRLVINGTTDSIIYALNNAGQLTSTHCDTLDGGLITERTITADHLVAGTITANEIAASTITADKLNVGNIFGNSAVLSTLTSQSAFINAISTNSVVVGASSTASSALTTANTANSTANSALTLVSIQDTRSTNQNPQWYMTNYPQKTVREFKQCSVLGISGYGTFCTLETYVQWRDSSGGLPTQVAYCNATASGMQVAFKRTGTSTTAWSSWVSSDISISNWCYNNDVTYIHGGKIYTGTITAAQIAAKAITADKINVTDLYAIGAKIGGFTITSNSLYSGTSSPTSNVAGTYLSSSGDIVNIGGGYTVSGTTYLQKIIMSGALLRLATAGNYTAEADPIGVIQANASGMSFLYKSSSAWMAISNPNKSVGINGTFRVSGSATITGDISVSGETKLGGKCYFGTVYNIDGVGNASLSNVSANNITASGGEVYAKSKITTDGALSVLGATTLSGNLSVGGSLTVGGADVPKIKVVSASVSGIAANGNKSITLNTGVSSGTVLALIPYFNYNGYIPLDAYLVGSWTVSSFTFRVNNNASIATTSGILYVVMLYK